ncbi:membrane-spanning 4-domains subfamily A member 18 [Onychomys torridus]|uniref:membrane-spanning 4-domains subfamily A member 18 n=1 Tax=Onychomys torridus TaxID=38674 RepID=UPI00167F3A37|nr:membrane-spanning 4-domains subfamily A member 18 [Onychomys torridus]
MNNEESVSAVNDPNNAHVTKPPHAVASGSRKKPLERTTYQAAKTLRYTEDRNLQNPHWVIQNPAGMTGLQAQPYSVGTAGVQCSPEITTAQVLPGDPQNPLNPQGSECVPEPTQTSSHPHWNMSSRPCFEFNPKKFINEEVRTLGGIQIIIGLFHIVSAVNPELYRSTTVLGISGYLIWGGLSFIISGFLSVWAAKDASSYLVSTNVGMNVISSIFSLLGIIIIIVDLCVSHSDNNLLTGCLKAISGGLLPFALLEFIITCMISRFGCQAVCLTHLESMTMASTKFSSNTVNMTNRPVYMTSGSVYMTNERVHTTNEPVNMTNRPVYTTNKHVHMTNGPVNMTDGPVNMTDGPVNMTDGPVNMTDGPVNSTSPDTNIPVQHTTPSNVPPRHSYKDRADLDKE